MMMEENKNANLLCLLLIRQTLWARRSSPKQAEMFHFSRADNHVLQSPPLNLFKNIYLIAFVPVKVEKLTSFCECQLKILGFYDAHLLLQLAKTY